MCPWLQWPMWHASHCKIHCHQMQVAENGLPFSGRDCCVFPLLAHVRDPEIRSKQSTKTHFGWRSHETLLPQLPYPYSIHKAPHIAHNAYSSQVCTTKWTLSASVRYVLACIVCIFMQWYVSSMYWAHIMVCISVCITVCIVLTSAFVSF